MAALGGLLTPIELNRLSPELELALRTRLRSPMDASGSAGLLTELLESEEARSILQKRLMSEARVIQEELGRRGKAD